MDDGSTERPAGRAPRTRVKGKYETTPQDDALRQALHVFRKERTVQLFGHTTLKTLGPGIVMPNDILQRIVDGAHFHLINEVRDVGNLTHWIRAPDLGGEVLALIQHHCPLPVPDPPALWANATLASLGFNDTGMARGVKGRTCGSCGATGHIGMSWLPYQPPC